MLFSAFSRPAVLLADNDSLCRDSEENSMDDLSSSTLACDSDGDILVNDRPTQRFRLPNQGLSVAGISTSS